MLVHNFDEIVNRRGTECKKYNPSICPEDILSMWIADTDFKSPKPVIDVLMERVQHGIYGYPVISDSYKQAVCCWEDKRFNWNVPVDAVEYVPGVIPGIICAVRALSHPGDNIVVQTPCYPPFRDLVGHNGRHFLENQLKVIGERYEIDFADLEQKLEHPRTHLFILCNPQNPTGRVFSREELIKMGNLCLKHDVLLLVDEIHCDLVYKGHKHIPFASISSEFAQNSVIFVNTSKTFNTAGLRTAALICMNSKIKSLIHAAVLDNKGIGENIMGTIAAIAAYTDGDYYANQLVEYLEENVDLVCRALKKTDKLKLIRPEGTYLLWLDCRKLNLPQAEVIDFFRNEAGIVVNDGITFGEDGRGFVRVNVATPRKNVEEALERMMKALERFK